MHLAAQTKPISFLKSHAADMVKDFATNPQPVFITQNGKTRMVVMEIAEYEKQQRTLALLKLLCVGKRAFEQGQFQSAQDFFDSMHAEE